MRPYMVTTTPNPHTDPHQQYQFIMNQFTQFTTQNRSTMLPTTLLITLPTTKPTTLHWSTTPSRPRPQNVSSRPLVPEVVAMGSNSSYPTPRAMGVMVPVYRSTPAMKNPAPLIVIGGPGDPGPIVP